MDKLKMHSVNKVDENVAKIGKLFPNCVTERKNDKGEVEYAIDFDMLKQELSDVVVEGNEERYQFTWPDKKKSILLANAPISKTLRPCREESVDFDNTENLYIEGDNLDVLKLLQETYLGKIKMIYIDPPYNTGNDFVYNDDFAESTDEYLANSGQFDDEGNRLVQNTESNGRYHTDWLNMIYPRLKLAKDLLAEDGVLLISIDDNEIDNLQKVCDEIFGENNFACNLVWQKKTGASDAKGIATITENILVYSKNGMYFSEIFTKNTSSYDLNRYKYSDEFVEQRGPYYIDNLDRGGLSYSDSLNYGIECPDGTITFPNGRTEYVNDGWIWKWSKQKIEWARKNNFIEFRRTDKKASGWAVCYKNYLKVDNENKPIERAAPHKNLINDILNANAASTMKELFNTNNYFNYSKPVELIKRFLEYVQSHNSVILDFFSGSATTAHAVMQLNAEDGGNRKFIMVQLPEETDEKSEAYKAGYKNICEIGKERIRRAGAKIKRDALNKTKRQQILNSLYEEKQHFIEEQDKNWVEMYCSGELTLEALKTQLIGTNHLLEEIEEFIEKLTVHFETDIDNLDTGFRVLKLDSTNMKDVYYNPAEYEMSFFDTLADNIKEDRTPEDLLFQVMLDLGVLLSSKIEETTISGKKVFNVADGFLYACFDSNITEDVITEIAKKEPYYFVMRDSSMANDSVATNFDQIFATYSPSTVRKVL